MTDQLGLSVGMTNLVAARIGQPPVLRRAVLTMFGDRPPEVGVPDPGAGSVDGPAPGLGGGMVLSGFVERVVDPVLLVSADGTARLVERLQVEAFDAMARQVGFVAPIAVAI